MHATQSSLTPSCPTLAGTRQETHATNELYEPTTILHVLCGCGHVRSLCYQHLAAQGDCHFEVQTAARDASCEVRLRAHCQESRDIVRHVYGNQVTTMLALDSIV